MVKQIAAIVLIVGGVGIFSYFYNYKFSTPEKSQA